MSADATLRAVLAAVDTAAGAGDLRAVEALVPAVESAVAAFERAPDAQSLDAVRAAAARAASRLGALRGGLHAARARLAEIGRLGAGESAYDASGARLRLAPPPSAAPLRR